MYLICYVYFPFRTGFDVNDMALAGNRDEKSKISRGQSKFVSKTNPLIVSVTKTFRSDRPIRIAEIEINR